MTGPMSALLGRRTTAHAVPALRLPDSGEPFLLVGRSRRCDVVVDDPTVSRQHAGLVLFGPHWFVCDRDSTNGTRVNGRRIWGTASVQPGDLVSFGDATFRLRPPARV
jgi:pSer/pThr/pTyr-binding forkhead associated (FHA) protein